jgi:hypothetical protein
MAMKQSPNPQTMTAARNLRRAYAKQFGHPCEDCGEAAGRRFRCAECLLLVCSWCIGHTHKTKADLRAEASHDQASE